MSATLRLESRQRLEVLAAAVLDYLSEAFTEAELDDDSNPPHTDLYNLAAAMGDAARPIDVGERASEVRLRADHERFADELATMALEHAEGRLEVVRRRLLEELGAELGA